MNHQVFTSMLFGAAAAIALCFSATASAALNVDNAKELARANGCFKCHGVDNPKDGPSYRKVAEKYRGKADAEEKLITHITSGRKVKFPDGHEEDHKIVNTKDKAEQKNLVDWILSL